MKKILIIKTSSLGDVIHTLPAVTDAVNAYPDIRFDWVVEQGFAEIPRLHPAVDHVIPIAFRKWRQQPLQAWREQSWQQFFNALRAQQYDLILDAQGLVKSALITRLARGPRCGLDWQSARESLASLFYQKHCRVVFEQQAVLRVRQLFAQALNYTLPNTSADYGLVRANLPQPNITKPYVIFLHGTTWATKHWPEIYWQQLAQLVNAYGMHILLPWGNATEQARAQRIAESTNKATVLPKSSLVEIASILAHAQAAIAVDTGLGHLAAALAVPTISLYGPTDPTRTGTVGEAQQHMTVEFSCAPCWQRECTYKGSAEVQPPCFATIKPQQVWQELQQLL